MFGFGNDDSLLNGGKSGIVGISISIFGNVNGSFGFISSTF